MIPINLRDEIKNLYEISSKHSNYQNMPYFVSDELGYKVEINEEWRGDTARYLFLKENIEFKKDTNVADVGANTGFFTLSFANNNTTTNFFAYEINENHSKLISLIKDAFEMSNVSVLNTGVDYSTINDIPKYDIMFHLNILHHAGVDFDKNYVKDVNDFYKYALNYLTLLRNKCSVLVFQMGYNLGGNKANPIVSTNDVLEMFKYQINLLIDSGFLIDKIALYDKENKRYKIVNVLNLPDELDRYSLINNSEFYKRPLIIAVSNN